MVQFNELPLEIVTHIFRSIPLSDIYLLIDKYAPVIGQFVSVITDSSNSKYTKLFKNVIQLNDFDEDFDKLTGISLVIFHIVNVDEIVKRKNDLVLQDIYKILKQRRKDTIFIIEELNLNLYENDRFKLQYQFGNTNRAYSIIASFSRLFNSYPHNNLLVMKNIVLTEQLPLYLNSILEVFHDSDIPFTNLDIENLEYLFQNLVIEDFGCFMVYSHEFFLQKSSSLIKDYQSDVIKEKIIIRGIESLVIYIAADLQEPFIESKHGRLFDFINANVESIKFLDIREVRSNYEIKRIWNHLPLESLLTFEPRIFKELKELHFSYANKLIMDDLSFPNLEKLLIVYTRYVSEDDNDSSIIVTNVDTPKLQSLEARYIGPFQSLKITDKNILQFGNKDDIKSDYNKIMSNDEIIYTFFSAILQFSPSINVKRIELNNDTLNIFNRMMNRRSDFTFISLEELSVICLIYSKKYESLNKSIKDIFMYKRNYTKLRILDIEIFSGGDPIEIAALSRENIPVLEELSIKASWESFNSIRGLQVISFPNLSFNNLRVLKLEYLILPNFSDLDLANLKEMYLKDVYEDEVFSGLSINGIFSSLETIELKYTDRKTILKEKASPEFQIKMDRIITVYLKRWAKLLPVITMETSVYYRLVHLKYSNEVVTIKLV